MDYAPVLLSSPPPRDQLATAEQRPPGWLVSRGSPAGFRISVWNRHGD
jgi:hypothetical protein